MQSYIVFLRAINVGGHTIKMDFLHNLFEELQFSNVATFIASGNVIFDARAEPEIQLVDKIEAHLEKRLGYKIAAFVRLPSELVEVTQYKPFSDIDMNTETNTLQVAFTSEIPTEAAVAKLFTFTSPFDEFSVHGRHIYWLCRKRSSESEFSAALLEKILDKPVTLRNITTLKKFLVKVVE